MLIRRLFPTVRFSIGWFSIAGVPVFAEEFSVSVATKFSIGSLSVWKQVPDLHAQSYAYPVQREIGYIYLPRFDLRHT